MVSNEEYIRMVNKAVKEGKFNRPIKVVYTKNRPSIDGQQGVSSHQPYKEYDKISIWQGLPKNTDEKRRYEERVGRKVIDRDRALRHELWHIHKPYASEKEVRHNLETKSLPRELPLKRRFRN